MAKNKRFDKSKQLEVGDLVGVVRQHCNELVGTIEEIGDEQVMVDGNWYHRSLCFWLPNDDQIQAKTQEFQNDHGWVRRDWNCMIKGGVA